MIYSYEKNIFQYNKIKDLDEKEIKNSNIKQFFKGHQSFLKETDDLVLEMFRKKHQKQVKKILMQFPKKKIIKVYLYSNAIESFNKSIIELFKYDLPKSLEISLIFKSHNSQKRNFKKNLINIKKSNISYDLKILLQTENKNINELVHIFNSIKSKKSLIIPTSLNGEILQGRIKRALKTIWNSKILYIYEPLLIIKLLVKFIKNK